MRTFFHIHVMEDPFLEIFKNRLDEYLWHMIAALFHLVLVHWAWSRCSEILPSLNFHRLQEQWITLPNTYLQSKKIGDP